MRRSKRTALNEALHELRRPLQVLALAGSESPTPAAGVEQSVRLAATALERLDREINGGERPRPLEPLELDALIEASLAGWRRRAALAGSTLAIAGCVELRVEGDRWALAQALDNLVVNAIEHGGPRIVLTARVRAGRLRISVRDCGRPLASADAARRRRVGLGDRIRGRARHGHGLRLVRRVAGSHGGRFTLHRSPGGAEAVLELPAS
jgi:signal transduction histidine kinase